MKKLVGVGSNTIAQATALTEYSDYNKYEEEAAKLDKTTYGGDDLGAVYSLESTIFKVWSPLATRVQVKLYKTGSDVEKGAELLLTSDMEFDMDTGVWHIAIQGDLVNLYYTYLISFEDGITNETIDVYAKAAGVRGDRGMVVDLDSTDPEGWDEDEHVFVEKQNDAIVWEVHVGDFSNSETSGVSKENRGKYLAFTESGTTVQGEYDGGRISTCVDYLVELGVTHVQLLPVFDFASVDEAASGESDEYNWGYDPKNYNVPEGSYSSNPYDGNVRITEFKKMIMALHGAGIGVIMDVVYNHTYETDSAFNKTAPYYYYRMNPDGSYSNGSDCGNETASEHAMYRKYMIDSIIYWATEYHIDGFRFDLMGCHDYETMNAIRDALDELYDGKGKKIIMYGEAWTGGHSTCKAPATMENAFKLNDRIGVFNDKIRDAIKGNVFDKSDNGYVQSGKNVQGIKSGLQGKVIDLWPTSPTQTVSYVSSHDNNTLYDKLVYSVLGSSVDYNERYENIVAMNKLSASIMMVSQGIILFQAGEEFARTKQGDANSYNSGIKINELDWTRLYTYSDLVDYYKRLIEIRKKFSAFADAKADSAGRYQFFEGESNVLGFILSSDAESELETVVTVFNPNDEAITITIPIDEKSTWVTIVDGNNADLKNQREIQGNEVTVKANSAVMLSMKTKANINFMVQ